VARPAISSVRAFAAVALISLATPASAPEGFRFVLPTVEALSCMPAAQREPLQLLDQEPGLNRVQQALAGELSQRYRIAAKASAEMVRTAYRAADEVGLDPLLVLAVISIESRFNPIAESVAGAIGLMQIIPRFHLEKLKAHGGEHAVFHPESNILVGARILQEYVHRTGSLEAGLQQYNGAFSDGSAKYALKVMTERARLVKVAFGR
jgi:soluble lytic murein transglycosylase-like protein